VPDMSIIRTAPGAEGCGKPPTQAGSVPDVNLGGHRDDHRRHRPGRNMAVRISHEQDPREFGARVANGSGRESHAATTAGSSTVTGNSAPVADHRSSQRTVIVWHPAADVALGRTAGANPPPIPRAPRTFGFRDAGR